MKPISPTLQISLNVECPHCKHYFDLFDDDHLKDDGWLYKQALPDTIWIDEHKKFELDYHCPSCEKDIYLKGIEW